jgi:peptidoglycan hydrolase-like protein with peptidoglycan-binding domain
MTARQFAIGFLAAAATLSPVLAEDRALIIGNENYSDGADITAADAALDAADALEDGGFTVATGSDLETDDMRALFSDLLAGNLADGRLILLLSGHFAQSPRETWFLGTDASMPDLATVGATGVSLATVLDIAAGQPGGAVVLLGTEPRRLPLGTGLEPGIGVLDVPQGVTLIRGDAARIAEFATEALTLRGQSLATLLDGAPDLTADGFIASVVPFRPSSLDGGRPDPLPGPDAEAIFWESTQTQGTQTAYEAYLKRYPQGRYAADAKAEVARIRAEPGRQARAAEDALALSRDDRRAIQRALSLLGNDPRGIDGMFGNGSRTAIAAWQKKNGHAATSYLTREQVVQLLDQADRRAAELEAEAEARRVQLERQDRLYWQEIGEGTDEAGLRAYLKRYPDGIYADVASDRLAAIDAARQDEAAAQDRAAWDQAQAEDTIASYRDYLSAFPDGAFAAEADTRIAALEDDAEQGDERAQWEAAEAALNLSAPARRIIETRLDALGLRPGPADGTFDQKTRRAIRRFQESRNLPTTGYLDQTTTVALLAGGVLRLGD